MTSPIADMLTQIRNALAVGKAEIVIPCSKLKTEVARILKENGYILDFEVVTLYGRKFVKIIPKYKGEKQPFITKLHLVSKPGRRVYATKEKLPVVLNNFGIAIISTSQGLMTNKEARKKKLGGEVICEVY